MTELKTLKDIENRLYETVLISEFDEKKAQPRVLEIGEFVCLTSKLKAEAIKWVKYDIAVVKNNPLLDIEEKIANRFINKWMERLNITEEDLKDE